MAEENGEAPSRRLITKGGLEVVIFGGTADFEPKWVQTTLTDIAETPKY